MPAGDRRFPSALKRPRVEHSEDRMNGIDGAEHDYREADKDRLIEELREAVRARDEFVSIAAHELRNPMTPILLQVHRVLASVQRSDRCRPEVLAPQVEGLERAVKEFLRRATALLDLSRVAAGNIRIEVSEVDLSRVAKNVAHRGVDILVASRDLDSPALQERSERAHEGTAYADDMNLLKRIKIRDG